MEYVNDILIEVYWYNLKLPAPGLSVLVKLDGITLIVFEMSCRYLLLGSEQYVPSNICYSYCYGYSYFYYFTAVDNSAVR